MANNVIVGEAAGKFIKLGGVNTYVSGDEANARSKFLFYFADAIGNRSINAHLIADEYAKAGFYVVCPDLLHGDPVELNPPEDFDLVNGWLPKHMAEFTQPDVDKVVDAVYEQYNPQFAMSIGFCFGAKYAIRSLGNGKVKAVSVFHPSWVTIDEVKRIRGPLLITAPDDDLIYTTSLRRKTEDALKELGETRGIKYRQNLVYGIGHGFASRGDISDPWIKFSTRSSPCTQCHRLE